MKRRIPVRGIAVVLITFTMFLSCSCNKDDKKESKKTPIVEVDNASDYSGSDSENNIEIYAVSDSVELEVDIFCDVTVPEDYQEGYPVYNMGRRNINEEYFNGIADKIFDDGEYMEFVPAECCTKEEAKQFILKLDEIFAHAQESVDEKVAKSRYFTDLYEEYSIAATEEPVAFRKKECIYVYSLKNNADSSATDTEYSRTYYMGYIDGLPYMFCYNDDTDSFAKRITVTRLVEGEEKNTSDISCEELKKGSTELVKKLDSEIPDSPVLEYAVLKKSDDNKEYYNGYKFVYKRADKEISALPSLVIDAARILRAPEVYYEDDVENNTDDALQESWFVTMDQLGLAQLIIVAPYCDYKVVEENANVIDVDDAKQYLEDYIKKVMDLMEEYPDRDYDIESIKELNKMNLCYVSIKYDDDYAMVPVWVLSKENKDTDYSDIAEGESGEVTYLDMGTEDIPYIGINALDGSIIKFDYFRKNRDLSRDYLSIVY